MAVCMKMMHTTFFSSVQGDVWVVEWHTGSGAAPKGQHMRQQALQAGAEHVASIAGGVSFSSILGGVSFSSILGGGALQAMQVGEHRKHSRWGSITSILGRGASHAGSIASIAGGGAFHVGEHPMWGASPALQVGEHSMWGSIPCGEHSTRGSITGGGALRALQALQAGEHRKWGRGPLTPVSIVCMVVYFFWGFIFVFEGKALFPKKEGFLVESKSPNL